MTRCGLLLSVGLMYITFFEAQKMENFVQRMSSQNENNPYVLYNEMSDEVITKGKTWVKVNSFSGGWWGDFFFNVSVNKGSANDAGDLSIDRRLAEQSENVLKIKMAALFRHNIIKTFGYILHRPQMELNSELYTSLYFIYTSIKLNHVDIIGMVSILSDLAFKTSNDRFLHIFSAMEIHLPDYLKCSATVWKNAIQIKEIDMDVIFQPYKNSPLVVDILDGMNQDLLNKVTIQKKVEDPKNDKEKDIFYNLNINILQMMRRVKDNSKDIQPTFLGALIQFFPRTYIQPDLEESVAVVTQYFDQNKIKAWNNYVSQLSTSQKENPYDLVMQMFNKLKGDPIIPKDIRNAMTIIEENLFRRNPTAINPYYTPIASLVVYDNIKMEDMLNYIPRELFHLEVVVAAARVRYYYDKGNIRRLNLMQHFNPYTYQSPIEIFLALLVRILKRQPDLPLEIYGSAGAVYSNLLISYRHLSMPVVNPDDIDVPVLTNFSLRSPEMDAVLWVKTKNLHLYGPSYQKYLERVPVYRCVSPLWCYSKMLEELLDHKRMDPKKRDDIKDVIEYIQHVYHRNVTVKKTDLFNTALGKRAITPITMCSKDESKNVLRLSTLTAPTEGEPHSPTTAKPTSPILPTTFSININRDNGNKLPYEVTILTIPKLLKAACLPSTPENIKQVKSMIRTFETVKSKLNFSDDYLIPIIHWYFKLPPQEKKQGRFLQFVNNFKPYNHPHMLMELEPSYPDLSSLIDAVPPPFDHRTGDSEWRKYFTLKTFLQDEHLFKDVEKDLKTGDYKNVATLLTAILKLERQSKRRRPRKQLEAIRYYADKVQPLGFGQAKVPWGVDVQVFNKAVDIGLVMGEALNYVHLDNRHKAMFKTILKYLKQNPRVLKSWTSWGIHRSAGEFTAGLFQHIYLQDDISRNTRNAIEGLRGLIISKADCRHFT